MPAALNLLTPIVTAEPGGEAVAELKIRNTGSVVDQYVCNLVGDASAWARCDPPFVSLFPGAEEVVRIHFNPPRSSAVEAGLVAYGVRVAAQEDPDWTEVAEGSVQIAGFAAVVAKVVPRTSEGKRVAHHRVDVTNTGNSEITAALVATDPDNLLFFKFDPEQLVVPAGQTGTAKFSVHSRKKVSGRAPKRRPFSVEVTTGGPPVRCDAAMEQKPGANPLIFVAILAVAALLFVLLQQQADAAVLF